MPYQKDKQQAFQAAQQAVEQAKESFSAIERHQPDEGTRLKQARQEIEEAEVQIEKALTVSTEHQHEQLAQFQQTIDDLKQQI